ncbi:MarR family transcriptional regulator [Salegentibacter sp. JZCK2]|uniref:MarR family winged helix-turn-helix transcriptional regulator n=1 Tax=Salegentibacter tibetensis TaxID=2873600 RepID=UPI001CCFF5B4|nr:MarR family transcriptional regulator [Salegentibacter tibetensis]MBZ9729909.1 MarR family transcriptional regulator [Salegentibacter tibetensis]
MEYKASSETIFYQIEKAIKQYRVMAQGNLNKLEYKVTINQILLMLQIDRNPEISQVELAELLFKDVASVTRMIELLVKRNFLLREEDKKDRRKKALKTTDKGKRVLELAIPIIKKNREIAQNDITEEEKEILFKLLGKIILNTSK